MSSASSSNGRWRLGLTATAAIAALTLCAQLARAADPTDTEDVPRLRAGADYVLSLMSSFRSPGGKWDPYGNYTSFPDGSSAMMWMNIIAGSMRLTEHWEVATSFMIRDSQMSVPSGSMRGASIGSPALEARYTLNPRETTRSLFDGQGNPVEETFFSTWPLVTLRAGLTLPFKAGPTVITGNPAKDLQNNDDDGSGNYVGFGARVGIAFSKRLPTLRLTMVLGAGVSIPFAQTATLTDDPSGNTTINLLRGKQIQVNQGLAYTLTPKWRLSAGIRESWGALTYANDQPEEGTASRSFATGLGVGYQANQDLRVSMAYETPWPFYTYLVNQSYAPGVSLNLAYSGI